MTFVRTVRSVENLVDPARAYSFRVFDSSLKPRDSNLYDKVLITTSGVRLKLASGSDQLGPAQADTSPDDGPEPEQFECSGFIISKLFVLFCSVFTIISRSPPPTV